MPSNPGSSARRKKKGRILYSDTIRGQRVTLVPFHVKGERYPEVTRRTPLVPVFALKDNCRVTKLRVDSVL